MPAESMPHIQVEIRPQVAVTSASKFKAKPEASAEAEIPYGRGRCGHWPQPRLVGHMGDFLGPPSALNGQRQALATTVQEEGPESDYEPLGR